MEGFILFWRGFNIYRGKFAFQNLLGLPYRWKEIYRFCFVLSISGQFAKYKSSGGLYFKGQFNGGFFAKRIWEANIGRSLYMEGLFGI